MNMNKILFEQDFYCTSDLALAAFLALTYTLDSIDFTNPPRAQFKFIRDSNMDKLVQLFWTGEVKVEPQSYFNQLKQIKSRLRSRF